MVGQNNCLRNKRGVEIRLVSWEDAFTMAFRVWCLPSPSVLEREKIIGVKLIHVVEPGVENPAEIEFMRSSEENVLETLHKSLGSAIKFFSDLDRE